MLLQKNLPRAFSWAPQATGLLKGSSVDTNKLLVPGCDNILTVATKTLKSEKRKNYVKNNHSHQMKGAIYCLIDIDTYLRTSPKYILKKKRKPVNWDLERYP